MRRKLYGGGVGTFLSVINHITFPIKRDTGIIVRFDPSKNTDNLGDYIIMRYCSNILNELFADHYFVDISVHKQPTQEDEFKLRKTKYSFCLWNQSAYITH